MSTTIQIISGVIQTGAVSFLVYMIIKGLKTEVKTLQNSISNQNETIKIMDKRIKETEEIGNIYKNLVSDLPQTIDNYKTVITQTKDAVIFQLKSKLEEQDTTIFKLKESTENSDNKPSSRTTIIKHLLFGHDHRDLLQFIMNIEPNLENIFNTMVSCSSFKIFLKELKIDTNIVLEENSKDIFNFDKVNNREAKSISHSIHGKYLITFTKNLYITKAYYNYFKEDYNSIK